MARLTTTGSNRSADAVSTNGLTARERSRIATAQAVAAATQAQAEAEKAARVAPVTGTATGYDAITGDWLVETPDGGTLRTQSLSNASLAGKRLPIQRFADSQTSTVNTPPTEADGSWVVSELEALQRDVVALGAVQVQDRDPEGAADARYPGDKWLNNTTPALFVWDAAAATWVETGGGGSGTKIAVCNFSDSSDFEFDFRNVPWDAPRKDDFTGTFATDGQIIIPAAGWYRLSMFLYQFATDVGIERQITYQFELTLRNAANATVDLGEDKSRLLSFGGFSNFDPGTGQAEWTFAAPGPGRTDLFLYWYGETSGGGIISEAFVSGRFMLEKIA